MLVQAGARTNGTGRDVSNRWGFGAQATLALLNWYRANARDLPWRRTRDPYRILVSEVMLQQTQVERVVPKYYEFLRLFPAVEALADAPRSTVIRAWSGLGYNRRALNLQRACQIVVEQHGGEFPRSVAELRRLPGLGPYTAGAVACFAFEQDVAFADTNIRRVLHRAAVGPDLPEPKLSPRDLQDLAEEVLPTGKAYEWNQALIELGATVCRARTVACDVCPIATWCAARETISELLAVHVKTRKSPGAVRFEDTSRYVRGRIVELLRLHPRGLTTRELEADIRPSEDAGWISPYLDALAGEGLITTGELQGVGEDSPGYDGEETVPEKRYRLPD